MSFPAFRLNAIALISLAFVLGFTASNGAAKKDNWVKVPKERIAGLEHHVFESAAMQIKVGYNIYLPPGYSSGTQRYPVIYYLHGIEGDESSYLDYARILSRQVQRGALPPVILVLVNGGETSFYSDSPDRTILAETCFIQELLPHIDRTYRTIAVREGRALHGYSMGGFGALKFGLKYPHLFSSVVAYGATLPSSGQMKDKMKKVYAKMFQSEALFEQSNPLTLAEQNADKCRGQLALRIALGSKDELLDLNRRFHQKLQALNIPHEYEEVSGVPHKKERLYEKVAEKGFLFSAQAFRPVK